MKYLNKFSVYIVVFLYLAATTGIPIYMHVCEKSGTTFYSSCDDCRHLDEAALDCCGNPIHNATNESNVRFISCCVDEVIISKADITINIENLFRLNKSEIVLIEDFKVLTVSLTNNYLKVNYPFIPPPDYGRKLIIKNNELKIDLVSC